MAESATPKILVVDDNPSTLYTTSRVLRAAGFDVVEAATGTSGIERARGEVDLVVLDVNLPDISGFEVCRRLRADLRTAHLPVIHLSATFVKDVDKVQGYDFGADGYLTHPVEPPVLVATVQAFLRARQAEERTRRSEAKFRSIFDNAMSGIALLDHQLVCLEANAALPTILDRSADGFVGTDLRPFLAHSESGLAVALASLAANGRWRGSSSLRTADGGTVHLDWHIAKHALPGVYLAIVNDVSALVQLEDERTHLLASERAARADAERANRSKDEFLATLSHDLRGPLGAIVNWVRVLKKAKVTPDEHAEALRAIERNAALQVQLIADLLDVSRIVSGKLRLDLQVVDAEHVVDRALEVVRGTAQTKGVALTKAVQATARWLSADAIRLQQVVWNLLSNAVKFTPAGGRVDVVLRDPVAATASDTEIEIVVSDSGEGIPRDLLPHVFDRFRQGTHASPRQDGLGLGLSIVRHLVEVHGGSVRAESDGPGKGATFIVRLPARSEPASLAPSSPVIEPCGPAHRLDGARLLVVDDDADMRVLLQRVLEDRGAEVKTADGYAAAMAALRTFAPHLLVSDIGMPGRDGYELIRDVRASGLTAERLPAVAVTAFAGDAERQRILAAGFQRHVAKPITPYDLTAAIGGLLRVQADSAT